MTEYLDNIFTDDDLTSQEFTDDINKEQDTEKSEESVDPLLEVIQKEKVEVIEVIRTIVDDLSNEEKIKILRKPRNIASIAVDEIIGQILEDIHQYAMKKISLVGNEFKAVPFFGLLAMYFLAFLLCIVRSYLWILRENVNPTCFWRDSD